MRGTSCCFGSFNLTCSWIATFNLPTQFPNCSFQSSVNLLGTLSCSNFLLIKVLWIFTLLSSALQSYLLGTSYKVFSLCTSLHCIFCSSKFMSFPNFLYLKVHRNYVPFHSPTHTFKFKFL